MLASVDWTVVGVLLTAAFTGGLMLLAAIAAVQSYRGRHSAIAHSLALTRMLGAWLDTDERRAHHQIQLAFEMGNNSDEALRYEVEHLKLLVNNGVIVELMKPPNNKGVVAAKMGERFTLDPVWVPASTIPGQGEIEFTLRYGRAAHDYEWREVRAFNFPLASPDETGMRVEFQALWTRRGDWTITEL